MIQPDIHHHNARFLQLVREDPNSPCLLIEPMHRRTVGGINSLREPQVDSILRPAASLLFLGEFSTEEETSRESSDNRVSDTWAQEYWALCLHLARAEDRARFHVLTGLGTEIYTRLRTSPLHEILRDAHHTRFRFRHNPQMWSTILELIGFNELNSGQKIAPLMGVYSAHYEQVAA